jgi:hypothetical protein
MVPQTIILMSQQIQVMRDFIRARYVDTVKSVLFTECIPFNRKQWFSQKLPFLASVFFDLLDIITNP